MADRQLESMWTGEVRCLIQTFAYCARGKPQKKGTCQDKYKDIKLTTVHCLGYI